jgi:hypothetical protein
MNAAVICFCVDGVGPLGSVTTENLLRGQIHFTAQELYICKIIIQNLKLIISDIWVCTVNWKFQV